MKVLSLIVCLLTLTSQGVYAGAVSSGKAPSQAIKREGPIFVGANAVVRILNDKRVRQIIGRQDIKLLEKDDNLIVPMIGGVYYTSFYLQTSNCSGKLLLKESKQRKCYQIATGVKCKTFTASHVNTSQLSCFSRPYPAN